MKLNVRREASRATGGVSFQGAAEYEPGTDPELRDCPFCGGNQLTVTFFGEAYEVSCACGVGLVGEAHPGGAPRDLAAAKTQHAEALTATIERWNHRIMDPRLKRALEEARAELEKFYQEVKETR